MYYKGNTIGLNYDAATGNWSFNNEPNDFIDTNAFSTADPKFDYVPPSNTTPDDPENDPCPAGYKYDATLKQCVIDPDYQNPFADEQTQTTGGGGDITPVRIAGTDRTTTDGNFIATDDEYNKMTPSELIENYKQRGFVKLNDKGQLVVDLNRVQRKGGVLDALLGRMGKEQVEGQASVNKVIKYLVDNNIVKQSDIYVTDNRGGTGNYTFNSEVVIPTIAKFEADYYGIPYSDVIAPGFGDKIFGTTESVQQFDDFMAKKLAAFSTVANNAVSNYTEDNYRAASGIDEIEKEKARKAKFDADIAAEKAKQEMQKTIKEEEERQEKKDRQKEEFDNLSNLKQGESYTDDSGDTYTKTTSDNRSGDDRGQGFTFTPSKTSSSTKTYANRRRGGYTGSTAGRGGTAAAKTPSRRSESTKANTARTSSRVSSSGRRRAYGL